MSISLSTTLVKSIEQFLIDKIIMVTPWINYNLLGQLQPNSYCKQFTACLAYVQDNFLLPLLYILLQYFLVKIIPPDAFTTILLWCLSSDVTY